MIEAEIDVFTDVVSAISTYMPVIFFLFASALALIMLGIWMVVADGNKKGTLKINTSGLSLVKVMLALVYVGLFLLFLILT